MSIDLTPPDGELVPVTVIGGYLGAGKTTMINRLLAGDHGQRLAVLVNDFGSVNVDAALIASHDGTTLSLENGCICCSIADAMGDALDSVLAINPDHIVIEASGVADPAKVGVYGQGWPGCRLASIVVLADVTTIRQRADDRFVGPLVRTQLAAADVIHLTRVDMADEELTAAVREWIDSDAWIATRAPADAVELFDSALVDVPADVSLAALHDLLDSFDEQTVRVKGIVAVDHVPHAVNVAGPHREIRPAPGAVTTGLLAITAAARS